MFDFKIKGALAALTAVIALAGVAATPLAAQSNTRTVIGERYVPTIWVDPDGCEHWVMDDGAEGYMTPHVSRQGIPVCRRGNLCGTLPADQFFATDSYRISSSGQQRLQEFFRSAGANGYIVTGHTDSRASDAYNLRLSQNRANSVARVGKNTNKKSGPVSLMCAVMANATHGFPTTGLPIWPKTVALKSSA